MEPTPSPLRRDFRSIQKLYGDRRTAERLTAHYEIEIKLAENLRRSTKENRGSAYRELYSVLLARVPDHPRWTRKRDQERGEITKLLRLLKRFILPDDRVLEIGAGDAELSRSLSDSVASIVAVDVDDALVSGADIAKPNFRYLLSSGVSLPLPDASVSFAFSNQVLEHIHPDDTMAHLQEVSRVLTKGGRYFILTPNIVAGPHDVSRYFDRRARGTHLREFDAETIRNCLLAAGFRRVVFYAARGGIVFSAIPSWLARGLDRAFALVPASLHTSIVRNKLARALTGLTVIAHK